MQNSNSAETQPTSLKPEADPDSETKSVSINRQTASEETIATPVSQAVDPLAQTIPAPVQPPADPPAAVAAAPIEPPLTEGAAIPPASDQPTSRKKGRFSWLLWAFFAILLLLGVAGLSGYSGWLTGIDLRTSAQATGVAQEAQTQFDLAVQNLDAKQCVWAKQRLELVVQLDPGFPGAMEKLSDAIYCLSSTATPTPAPTVTLTPTPDLRPVEDLFTQAQQYLATRDWSKAIETLLNLRLKDPTSNAVQVDGMLYVALRNRGVEKISKEADLEGGIYDLALAERFGPLDLDALSWREWSKWYIRGAAFWEVDWAKSISYFSQVAPIAPNLRDASGWTASDRYRIALTRYGDQLLRAGDYCGAQQQYEAALALLPNPTLEPTATAAAEQCSSGGSVEATPVPEGSTPPPEIAATATETPPPPAPTDTPAPTATVSPYP